MSAEQKVYSTEPFGDPAQKRANPEQNRANPAQERANSEQDRANPAQNLANLAQRRTDSMQTSGSLAQNSANPELSNLEDELLQELRRRRVIQFLKNIGFTMATVAAIAILITTLWMPVLRIFGTSMTSTLYEGDVVLTLKSSNMKQGDVIAFYYNNTVLVKRLIGFPGDWIDIDENGDVYVNGQLLDEPYVDQKAFGECDIELPCQVPENRVFVLGDHRSVSIDSRNTSIGFIPNEQVVGAVLIRIWPLTKISRIH